MKKLLVAAVAAVLALASCSTGYVANDSLASPDVKAVVTDNGVAVLTWDPVKDASYYAVYTKEPGTDVYVASNVQVTGSNGFEYRVIPVYKTDKEYSFKVVATSSTKYNLMSSETEVSVTTPEAWKDYALDASRIKVDLVGNTLNAYNVSLPADAGYKYDVKLVNKTGLDAKALYDSTTIAKAINVTASTVAGASKVAGKETIKVKSAEGEEEEKEVDEAVWFGQATVTATSADTGLESYYAVVKATPVNGDIAKTTYAISSVAAKYNPAAIAVSFSTQPSVTQTGATKARVSFALATTRDGKDVDVSKVKVYRQVRENTAATLADTAVNVTGAIEEVKGLTKSTTLIANDNKAVTYYVDDTIKAYDQLKAYYYTYYVVAETEAGQVYSNVANLTVAGNNAWKRSLSTPVVSVTNTADNKVKVSVSNVARGATLSVKYFDFDSASAAAAATDGELSKAVPVTLDAGQAALTAGINSVTTEDGVATGTTSYLFDNVTYSYADFALDPAVTVTNFQKTNGTVITQSSDTNNYGKYYVVKAFVTMDGCDPVESKAVTVTIKKTVDNIEGVTTTSWSNYSAITAAN